MLPRICARLTFLLLVLGLLTTHAQEQAIRIIGVVVGARNKPLAGAEVSIVGLGSSITTGSGQFSISASPYVVGQKVTFEVTMPGWHLPPSQPTQITVPRDSIQNPIRFTMLRDRSAGRPVALPPGLYLSHLVGRVGDERGPTTASVWLSAAGPETYIVDSIHITHHAGHATSVGSGAVKPDATYSFAFTSGSNETCVLNPALRLDSRDRREVWFTLALAPTGSFSTSGGWVEVWLQYHVETRGSEGNLPVMPPPKEAVMLSKLLNRAVQIGAGESSPVSSSASSAFPGTPNGRVPADPNCHEDGVNSLQFGGLRVSPEGLVQGNEEGGEALVYSELSLDGQFLNYYTGALDEPRPPNPPLTVDVSRQRLNQAIAAGHLAPAIARQMRAGESAMFDLCAGLNDPECHAALVSLLHDSQLRDRALHAITLNEALFPDPHFPEIVVGAFEAPGACGRSSQTTQEISAVLVAHPTGKWLEALLAIAECGSGSAPGALRALARYNQPLTAGDGQRITRVCRTLLSSEFPQIEAGECLLKMGMSATDINAILDAIPPGVDAADRQRVIDWRNRLKEELRKKLHSE